MGIEFVKGSTYRGPAHPVRTPGRDPFEGGGPSDPPAKSDGGVVRPTLVGGVPVAPKAPEKAAKKGKA